ncbi:MAG: protein phosphatase 2C domain-containing protein [Desulfamplus sp.]|nr:protein phosphatase 2C domain-containing protein [Desulfamplus sp.]
MFSTWWTKWRWISATVPGPSHVASGIPNQDSIKIVCFKDSVIAVVCDGLGSHSNSDIGSRSACESVVEAASYWLRKKENVIPDLLRLIQTYWLIKLRPLDPNNCGSTCLFAIARGSGKLIVCRLGDGMIIVDDAVNPPLVIQEDKKGFANQTTALAEKGILGKWEWKEFELQSKSSIICLMTDGISEDIEPDSYGEIPKMFRNWFKLRKSQATRILLNELNNWTTPHHQDDKSIVALMRR